MRYLLSLLTGLVLLQSCFKEKSEEARPAPVNPTNPWTFTVDGKTYIGEVTHVRIDSASGAAILSIGGTDAAGVGQFQLLITATDLVTGEYRSPASALLYLENANPVYQSDGMADNFVVNITELSETRISGNFSGNVQTPAGASLTITNGSFTGLR